MRGDICDSDRGGARKIVIEQEVVDICVIQVFEIILNAFTYNIHVEDTTRHVNHTAQALDEDEQAKHIGRFREQAEKFRGKNVDCEVHTCSKIWPIVTYSF